jgi:hypothetical protein
MADKDQIDINTVYKVLSNRRNLRDDLLWRAPVLGLTAQAFLLTIALNSASSVFAKIFSSFLAIITSFMSMQLMAKHRYFEKLDNLHIEQLEEINGITKYHGNHENLKNFLTQDRKKKLNTKNNKLAKIFDRFIKLSSYHVWMFGLSMFAIVSFTVMMKSIILVLMNIFYVF